MPIAISTFFSLLSFSNVRRIVRRQIPIVRRRLDRQLTAMILVRVALFVITITPFVCIRAYQLNQSVDSTNSYAVAVDQLIRSISTTCHPTLTLRYERFLFGFFRFSCCFSG